MILEATVECRERCVDFLKECSNIPQKNHLEHEQFNEEGDHPKKRNLSFNSVG